MFSWTRLGLELSSSSVAAVKGLLVGGLLYNFSDKPHIELS